MIIILGLPIITVVKQDHYFGAKSQTISTA